MNEQPELNKAISDIVEEVMNNRARVIDDFCKVYLAARADWFKEKPERLKRIVLVSQRSQDGMGETMWFEIKRGKLKNQAP